MAKTGAVGVPIDPAGTAAELSRMAGFFGVYLSWFVDVSSGATVVLLQAAMFVLALGSAALACVFDPIGQTRRGAALAGAFVP